MAEGRWVRSENVYGTTEVAHLLNVGVAAVSMWTRRKPEMPDPLRMLASGPVWDVTDVLAWYRRWKRLPADWDPRVNPCKCGCGRPVIQHPEARTPLA